MTSLTAAIVTYNRSAYLGRIIPTILAQTFRAFELLVLDSASTDDTEAVVHGFADPRIRSEHGEEVDAVLTACFSDADLAIAERFKTQPRSAPGWVASWRELLLLEAPDLMLGGVRAEAPRVLPELLKVA